MSSIDMHAQDVALVNALQRSTYAQVSDEFDVSRGRIYAAACRLGARKNEARILARRQQRKHEQQTFLKSVLNATATADVLDFLDGIPDGSAQLVLTSPPYNVGRCYGGERTDAYSLAYYTGWLMTVCAEAARVLADGGVLFLQVGATRGPAGEMLPIDMLMFQHLQGMGLTFNSRVIWTIPHGLTPKRRLAERHETALVFSKGPVRTFNPTPARKQQRQPGKKAFKGPKKGQLSGHPFGAWPTNVWDDIGNAGHNKGGRVEGHPAQMPSELARRAILLFTEPGDLVIDPFSGSGTTHAECVRTGRAFSGADLFYEDVRRERLAKVSPDLISMLPGVSDESMAVWNAQAEAVHVPASQNLQLELG